MLNRHCASASVLFLTLLSACSDSGTTSDEPSTPGGGVGGEGGQAPEVKGPEVEPADFCEDRESFSVPVRKDLKSCSSTEGKRCLNEEALARKAVSYSGYREGQDPRTQTFPNESEILEDLELLIRGGFGLIRLFDSGVHGTRVLKVIADNDLDLVVHLGVWIDGPDETAGEANQGEIDAAIALANQYPDTVVWVSVGNEVLDDWSSVLTPVEDLVEYVRTVREAIKQPVTTDDMFIPFQMKNNYAEVAQVMEEVDFLSVHVYAFIDAQWSWDWKQRASAEGPERASAMMAAGLEFTKSALRGLNTALVQKGFDLPILIGEAGWKSRPTKPAPAAGEEFRGHPVNQQLFYDDMMSWTYGEDRDEDSPLSLIYFEAFDEPWKGTDDGWGLFDVERRPKRVIRCTFPDLEGQDPARYQLEDAVHFLDE